MPRVKFFDFPTDYLKTAENKVNEFIESNNIDIVDLKVQHLAEDEMQSRTLIILIYKEWCP